MYDEEKMFPVLNSGGWCVPHAAVERHARQCKINHGQTVKRLKERGGLDWSELVAVLSDAPWRYIPENLARDVALELIAEQMKTQETKTGV